ncbi:hypothetical protein CEXT_287531 [Caerostris extrusa]|uniref:Uncharacterized protein n=1 Tax=Caerostris extrusa TaxID=172846 RepID=A0AAV4QCX0_CAEEX|nr:hypothetical protein CEXT_287531 [Caerostris extrusa]
MDCTNAISWNSKNSFHLLPNIYMKAGGERNEVWGGGTFPPENSVASFPEEIGIESEIMKLKPGIEPRSRDAGEGEGGGRRNSERCSTNSIRELMVCLWYVEA